MSGRFSYIDLIVGEKSMGFYDSFSDMVQILGRDMKFYKDVELGDRVTLNFHSQSADPADIIETFGSGDLSLIVDRWTYLVESVRLTSFENIEDDEFKLYPPSYISGSTETVLRMCGAIDEVGTLDKSVPVKILKLKRVYYPLEGLPLQEESVRTGQNDSQEASTFPRIRPNRRTNRWRKQF